MIMIIMIIIMIMIIMIMIIMIIIIIITMNDLPQFTSSAAARSEAENRRAVQLQRPKAPFWKCEVTRCSALQQTRIQDVWNICSRWNKGALETGVVCDAREYLNT